jgi:hypothetical protein
MFVMLVAVAFASSAQSQSSLHHSIEQTRFTAEDTGAQSPVEIPHEVMTILAADDAVKRQMANQEPTMADLPQARFSASKIRLGPPKTVGLIVQATGPLAGGNVSAFWVFIQLDGTWKQALMVPAHDLIVMQTRSNGYRNLEASATTCCKITTARFRFDGREYKRYLSRVEDIK